MSRIANVFKVYDADGSEGLKKEFDHIEFVKPPFKVKLKLSNLIRMIPVFRSFSFCSNPCFFSLFRFYSSDQWIVSVLVLSHTSRRRYGAER
jgi:hypothetical protein